MKLNEYQNNASKTAIFDHFNNEALRLSYLALGTAGEAGEIAEKIKKILRDGDGNVTEQNKEDIVKEMGDVLWYLSQLARELGVEFEYVAKVNLNKLQSRKLRGKLHGSGDDR